MCCTTVKVFFLKVQLSHNFDVTFFFKSLWHSDSMELSSNDAVLEDGSMSGCR